MAGIPVSARSISNGVRILQIGADRAKRGILFPGSPAWRRQEAYAKEFGHLDIIGFSLKEDEASEQSTGPLAVHPTNSSSRLLWGLDALRIARHLPKPDVVSVQDPFETGLVALLIARRWGIPLHIQVHTDFLSPEYARLSFMNRLRVLVAGFVLRRAARIRVVSEGIKRAIKGKYHLNVEISVLPIFTHTVGMRQMQPDPALVEAFSRFDKKILFIGRLEPEKNPGLALRAFAEAAPERTCLIVVGNGSELKTLKGLAKKLGVMEGPRMVFFEEEAESAMYYPLADLVLVTSHYEGYGLVTIEALAPGVPVLSTDVGIACEAGAIIAPPEKFADALKQWFKDGPREGRLKSYPYADFDEYVRAYCADIIAVARK